MHDMLALQSRWSHTDSAQVVAAGLHPPAMGSAELQNGWHLLSHHHEMQNDNFDLSHYHYYWSGLRHSRGDRHPSAGA